MVSTGLGLVFFMSFNLQYLVSQFRLVDPFSYIGGKTTRPNYIAKFIPEYRAVQYINEHLPEDAKVSLVFLGNRGYYLDRAYLYGEEIFSRLIKGVRAPDRIVRRLKTDGVTHLLIQDLVFNKWCDYNFTVKEKEVLLNFFKNHTERVFHENGFSVLSVKEGNT
jgi:hypothetical protein